MYQINMTVELEDGTSIDCMNVSGSIADAVYDEIPDYLESGNRVVKAELTVKQKSDSAVTEPQNQNIVNNNPNIRE